MPTPDAEIDAAARRVFEHLGWWKPGQMCDNWVRCFAEHPPVKYRQGPLGVEIDHDPHEIPPPDWRDPALFLRLLMESEANIEYHGLSPNGNKRWLVSPLGTRRFYEADDPRAALILALDAMGKTNERSAGK